MKKLGLKPVLVTLAIGILMLKYPMSKSIELANLYSIISSVAVSLFLIYLILSDSWNGKHIKDGIYIEKSSLLKYRVLSVLAALLIGFETVLTVLKIDLQSQNVIQTLLLMGVLAIVWFRGRYAQGAQAKFSKKEILTYLILIILVCFLGNFLRSAFESV